MPTGRAVALLSLSLFLALASARWPGLARVALGFDAVVLGAILVDILRARTDVSLARGIAPVLSSSAANPVTLVLEREHPGRVMQGELRDYPPIGMLTPGHHFDFRFEPDVWQLRFGYPVTPPHRGDFEFGDVSLRVRGPWGLGMRTLRLGGRTPVKVYPDLRALSQAGLSSALTADAAARRIRRRPGEGREFDSLREYRIGDDVRQVDWKATARRGAPVVRLSRPEQNQVMLLFLDCGRHLAGRIHDRRKLDFAVDATLRLAQAGLAQGDRVGLVRFATRVQSLVPPQRGRAHLQTLATALYRAEASLEESDYGAAMDQAFRQLKTRALVVVLTDLVDPESARQLVARVSTLRPRHLPLVISLLDEDVTRAALSIPRSLDAAYVRSAAERLELDARKTVARLRQQGAQVVRVPATELNAASLEAYLEIKSRGRL